MEVISDRKAFLSNYEVLDILRGIKSSKQQKMTQNQLATITYQTIRYLEETPCKKQSAEVVAEFLKNVQRFELTKCEKLMLLNLCPKTSLEMQLIIEDCEDRFNDEEVESLLNVISTHLDQGEEEEEQEEGSQ